MKTTYLDFEQPVAELESKIEQLRYVQGESAVDIAEEIDRLRSKCDSKLKDLYDKLTPWQTAMVARHPQRPYTLDYIHALMTNFHSNKDVFRENFRDDILQNLRKKNVGNRSNMPPRHPR